MREVSATARSARFVEGRDFSRAVSRPRNERALAPARPIALDAASVILVGCADDLVVSDPGGKHTGRSVCGDRPLCAPAATSAEIPRLARRNERRRETVKGSARRPGVFMRSFLAAEVSDANLDCVEQIQARGGGARSARFVEGHDFSRAVKRKKNSLGFSP
jgi:hypothetical protein